MRFAAVLALLALLGAAGLGLWWARGGAEDRAARRGEGARGPEGAARETSPSRAATGREASGDEPDAIRWEVVLLGPGDAPLAGVPVRGYPEKVDYPTNAEGVARLPDTPGADRRLVAHPFEPHGRALTEPRTVLRFPRLLPLELRPVDGATGKPLPEVELAVVTNGGDLAPRDGVIAGSPLRPASVRTVTVEVRTPGWTTRDGLRFELGGAISAAARRAVGTVPLHREFEWTLELARGLEARKAMLDHGELAHSFEPGARRGVVRVRGVPFLPGEAAAVVVRSGETDFVVYRRMEAPAATTALGPEDLEEQHWESEEPARNSIGLGGRARVEHGGVIAVRVLRRNGEPAGGIRLGVDRNDLTRTNFGGVGVFGGLPPGEHALCAGDVGFVPARGTAVVTPNEATWVELAEPAGRTLQIRARDERDRPWSLVRVTVEHAASEMPYGRLRGGVQHVPLLTGPDGRIVLEDVGPEPVRLRLDLGAPGAVKRVPPDHPGLVEFTVRR